MGHAVGISILYVSESALKIPRMHRPKDAIKMSQSGTPFVSALSP